MQHANGSTFMYTYEYVGFVTYADLGEMFIKS
jgi:hypothetical protein